MNDNIKISNEIINTRIEEMESENSHLDFMVKRYANERKELKKVIIIKSETIKINQKQIENLRKLLVENKFGEI